MSGSCVVQLGDLLRANNSLLKLHLEWNCVGQHSESFAQFCSGLASNNSLECLNLRSDNDSDNTKLDCYREQVSSSFSLGENLLST